MFNVGSLTFSVILGLLTTPLLSVSLIVQSLQSSNWSSILRGAVENHTMSSNINIIKCKIALRNHINVSNMTCDRDVN